MVPFGNKLGTVVEEVDITAYYFYLALATLHVAKFGALDVDGAAHAVTDRSGTVLKEGNVKVHSWAYWDTGASAPSGSVWRRA